MTLKKVYGSFNQTKDIEKTQQYCFECQIEAVGDYEKISESGIAEDWAILSFENYMEYGSPNYLIPSPSQVLKVNPQNSETIPDNYSCFVFGLSIPSPYMKSDIEKCKDTGVPYEQILRLIPDTQFSMSLGWLSDKRISDFIIPHFVNTCSSNSGSPLLTCNITVSDVMRLPVNDPLQKPQNVRDFIKSQTFNNKVIGIHCSHNEEINYACSVLKWFLPYYQIVFSQNRERFTEDDVEMIENEYVEYQNSQFN
ncbi:predicted protein [Naegleria gruberi]|uniref:Predicted protein n=1 Tax=Naegleria gruberi TaxID=5762 RepID=D2VC49_NAEGR|nr:uncharacterized protein NAEGRDRAFT_66447 [Naegleria gruberi]EFC45686.1 predicted protein [Naegleria gruberi]|eukprot:XP_002678430.1 predicted protein [Naegleria gruberi strain NEG-M]